MPVYDYTCAACGRRFEVLHGVHAEGPTSCPLCGEGPVRKAITAAAVHYRGSGWAKKERHAAASSSKRSGSDGASSDATAADESGTGSKSESGSSEGAAAPSGASKKTKKAETSPATAGD